MKIGVCLSLIIAACIVHEYAEIYFQSIHFIDTQKKEKTSYSYNLYVFLFYEKRTIYIHEERG